MKKKKEKARLKSKDDEQLERDKRWEANKVSWFYDINIKKYKPQGSYRGDSPLDD